MEIAATRDDIIDVLNMDEDTILTNADQCQYTHIEVRHRVYPYPL